MTVSVTVVGIGADGWTSLDEAARRTVEEAGTLLGGARHLAMVPPVPAQRRLPWPSPLRAGLGALLASCSGDVVALASGDPLVSGVGSTLIDVLGPDRVRIVPALSSVALARARMRWPAETTSVLSLVGRDPRTLLRLLSPGRRVLVLSGDGTTPRRVAELLLAAGFGTSELTVLSDLGTEREAMLRAVPAEGVPAELPALNIVAIECSGTGGRSLVAGLPDDAFEHDGQLTKRDVRASALSRLAPLPGQMLWDVGAGAGSVAVEWMRTDASCRAIAIESHPERAARIAGNAASLGVPALHVVHGRAPEALHGLASPDAVFIGGGATAEGVIDLCWKALKPAGRLVVHGVTLQTEALLMARYADLGGELTRLSVEQAAPLGAFDGWKPARTVTQWSLRKDEK
ncbi:precorrin-6y C5,15-methyltransferase (decarboxylating) subunit CbiE [Actinocorallia populi]|uniref:precorrin-6y C5,15-methyltransferase (decarboxylating) subunit CbiE n=1 Tax=Actinocorallia populi TaxID=2079200 RepID=UPI000D08DB4F|nr:precorrin-6y C5,15-methyltransferase (decarboxylating) subunit CbiE [Actinocorallia populi]